MSFSKIFYSNGDVAIVQRLGSLNREGSLSCVTCSDTGPRFLRSRPKDRLRKPLCTTNKAHSDEDPV